MKNDPVEYEMRLMLDRNQSRWRRPVHKLWSEEKPREPDYVHTWKGGGYTEPKTKE